ncbi:MAG: alcohol dehydrogenase [Gammaproteobacteria bacterium]|jgi:alcohol dehydrogenase
MRAAVIHEHGDADQLVYEANFPDPTPRAGDVIIRVKASSLNYHDVFTRRGMPGIKLNLPVIPGLDIAGEIAELGTEVTGWSVGERVLIDPVNRVEGGLMGETVHGGLAEYCRVPAHQLVRMPDAVSFEDAASLPVAYGTAHRMMHTIGKISAGEKVLVLGASGGVGTCCVLLAKMAGAEVIACASTEQKLARLKELGADHGINYSTENYTKWVHEQYGKPYRRSYDGGVDMVVNFTGGETWVPCMKALKRGGRMLTCGATAGFDPKTDLRYIWTFELQILGSNSWMVEDLTALMAMIEAGTMKPVIDKILSLEEAANGVRLIEDREVFGKIVITP